MGSVRARLSAMMFLQYFVWGAWAVEMGGYMGGVLNFSGVQIGSIYSTTAWAAILSPLLMGFLADRLFATEKVLAALHLVGAVLLACAAMSSRIAAAQSTITSEFWSLYVIMFLYALCYMPTLALTNSISFENVQNPDKDFPRIRLFGTIGWIVAGIIIGAMGYFRSTLPPNTFLFMAAGASAVLGMFSLALPHTPPKKAEARTTGDRRSILSLLADPSFLVFVVASFLICIPLAFYYNLANVFLVQIKAPVPTALQTIGQFSEIFFMAAMPWFIVRLGVKKMLAIGMLAWVVRYLLFGTMSLPLVFIGLLLHGICYDFFFVASQIYVDSRADVSQRATAQSFIAFVTLGLGMLVGAYAAGITLDAYPPASEGQPADWFKIWLWPALGAGATLIFFWFGFRAPKTDQAKP